MTDAALAPVDDFRFTCYDSNGSDTSIRVGWHPSEDLVKRIGTDPAWVLVCIFAKDGRLERRKLFPMLAKQGWIRFESAGFNQVRACVIVGDAREVVERASEEGYYYEFIRPAGKHTDPGTGKLVENEDELSTSERTRRVERKHGRTLVYTCHALSGTMQGEDFTIDAQFFAKDPAKWKKVYLKKFFDTKEVDQCHTRRRMWCFGYPFLLFYLLGSMLIRWVGLIVLFFVVGQRELGWKAGFHPFAEDTLDFFGAKEDLHSRYFVDKKGRPWFFAWWAFAPPILIVLTTIIWVIGRATTGTVTHTIVRQNNLERRVGIRHTDIRVDKVEGWFGLLPHDILAALIIAVGVFCLFWIGLAFFLLLEWLTDSQTVSAEQRKIRQKERNIRRADKRAARNARYNQRDQYAMLELARSDFGPKPEAIPKIPILWKKQSRHLWFHGVKRKVCKPYSK